MCFVFSKVQGLPSCKISQKPAARRDPYKRISDSSDTYLLFSRVLFEIFSSSGLQILMWCELRIPQLLSRVVVSGVRAHMNTIGSGPDLFKTPWNFERFGSSRSSKLLSMYLSLSNAAVVYWRLWFFAATYCMQCTVDVSGGMFCERIVTRRTSEIAFWKNWVEYEKRSRVES